MNNLIIILGCFLLSSVTLADDTEIYGTDGVDDDNMVNSNVLFIMDTSGSMDDEVTLAHSTFDPSFAYIGSYSNDQVFNDLDDEPTDGHLLTSLSNGSPGNKCADEITTLANTGQVYDRFQQERYKNNGGGTFKWRNSLQDGNNGSIRCDTNNDGISGQGSTNTLYSGKYMNWQHGYKTDATRTRMEVVVDVVKSLTYSLSNINLGLMRFDQDSYPSGGMIDVPVGDIATTGELIRDKLDGYVPSGYTPLEETMYEAMLYYRGADWDYGSYSYPNTSVAASLKDSDTYKTPIEATCQKNHIILLTDGEPKRDDEANSKIKTLISGTTLPEGLSHNCSGDGQCMDELAYWMKNTDHSDTLVNTQDITTYTIGGFGLTNGVELLKRTASWGGGQYYPADSTDGLTEALESIFLRILAADATFTAPAVSVNAFNTSTHRNELFYALFRPADNIKWAGNLKKYKVSTAGVLMGANDIPAVSNTTGFFTESAKDYYNSTEINDGSNVELGGMANLLDPANRDIYTEVNNSGASPGDPYPTAGKDLGSLTDNSSISSFNAANDTEYDDLLEWSYGKDVDDKNGNSSTVDSRYSIGDPLHSKPVIVTYGGSEANPDSTIYFGTNEGFIHAVDTESGLEEFAFLPQDFHPSQKKYYDDEIAASSKPYGMDGPISVWTYNTGQINSKYLYAGMRRGGNNYYALNITDRSTPKLLFKIEGSGGDPDYTGDFAKLGQTWSEMKIAKVNFAGIPRFVLFFTGGYDTNQDSNATAETDGVGNAVYMVDAKTGERLWWASETGSNTNISTMVNSMPSSPSLIDHDGDGFIDYLFTADAGGRIFRFDIDQKNTGASNFAEGGLIASIAGTDAANNRRFYNTPNVGLIKDKQYGDYLTIAIGSGHRAHPKNTTDVDNRFYVIKDRSPYGKPTSYVSSTEAPTTKTTLVVTNGVKESPDPHKLYNASEFLNGGETAFYASANTDLRQMLNYGGGFYITLSTDGEKVLSKSLTHAGTVIFTTFEPLTSSSNNSNSCAANTGKSKVYAMSLVNAVGEVRSLEVPGIPSEPVIIITEGPCLAHCEPEDPEDPVNEVIPKIGINTLLLDFDDIINNKTVMPVYWRQNAEH